MGRRASASTRFPSSASSTPNPRAPEQQPKGSEMAKSKNLTAHNQSYKAHRNGIEKPKHQRQASTKRMNTPGSTTRRLVRRRLRSKLDEFLTPAEPVAVEDLFSVLHRDIEAGEFPQAVKVADQVLVAAPGDEDAVRCKVVAHIKSDTTDKELTAIRAAERLPINQSYYK